MYRVDFCIPDHTETVDWLDYPLTAKQYASEIESFAIFMDLKEQGYGMPDTVLVKIIDDKNHIISEYWWKGINNEM